MTDDLTARAREVAPCTCGLDDFLIKAGTATKSDQRFKHGASCRANLREAIAAFAEEVRGEATAHCNAHTRRLSEEQVAHGDTQARVRVLTEALTLLVKDVQDYEAWQRPCHALNVARAALAGDTP